MRVTRNPIAALVVAATIAVGPISASAAEQSPEELAAEGVGRILDAMKLFIGSLPMYAAPEILPNGDIIIRRLNPPKNDDGTPKSSPKDDGQPDSTDT